MKTETAERQFHAALFQRKMEYSEMETEILKLEKNFRLAAKKGDEELWYKLQDQLGELYARIMKIWRIQNHK